MRKGRLLRGLDAALIVAIVAMAGMAATLHYTQRSAVAQSTPVLSVTGPSLPTSALSLAQSLSDPSPRLGAGESWNALAVGPGMTWAEVARSLKAGGPLNVLGVQLGMTQVDVARILGAPGRVEWPRQGALFRYYGRAHIGFSPHGKATFVSGVELRRGDRVLGRAGDPDGALVSELGRDVRVVWSELDWTPATLSRRRVDEYGTEHFTLRPIGLPYDSFPDSMAALGMHDTLRISSICPGMSRWTVKQILGPSDGTATEGRRVYATYCRGSIRVRYNRPGYVVEVIGDELLSALGLPCVPQRKTVLKRGQAFKAMKGKTGTFGPPEEWVQVEFIDGKVRRIHLQHDDPVVYEAISRGARP